MGWHGANEAIGRIRGLSPEQVRKSLEIHGGNTLTEHKRNSFLKEFLRNFGDPIIKILLIALVINVVIKLRDFEWYESIGIAVAILVSTFVSTLSEYGSESAFEKLQEDALRIKCRAVREGGVIEIAVTDVVVGDYVLIQAGDRVPADGQIVSGELYVDQSALNGETKEVHKSVGLPKSDGGPADATRVFRGCVVCSGEAVICVTGVGEGTFYGKLAREIQEETRESPLKARLAKLAGSISRFGYMGAGLVAAANLFNSIVLENRFDADAIIHTVTTPGIITGHLVAALTLAISVIVVAIPEGLPLMITVVLSSNMKRMLRDNVLVRKLVGIETSGSINILFTDKTGTLTKGKLKVSCFLTGDGDSFDSFHRFSKTQIGRLLAICALYNTGAYMGQEKGKPIPLGGNATERALLDYTDGGKTVKEKLRPVVTVPFSSGTKYSGVRLGGGLETSLYKGAPELILQNCTHYYDKYGEKRKLGTHVKLRQQMKDLTESAYRLLAVAVSDAPLNTKEPGKDLTLIGITAIRDEVRREASKAIDTVHRAGIQVVMITGDNKETAAAVAKECGLIKNADDSSVITGTELRNMSDTELKERLRDLRVVSRAVPSDKSRLITLSQEMGLVAGMTGDGINDAPALKKADVGFAMGSGTEVAKEAGDIVILDDNFSSIAKAILYGRTIFKSIRKFVIFQLTINFCAVGISVIGPFIGVDSPITVLQMLWVNMVMDTLAGLAFAGEPPLKEYMSELPKTRDEPILNRYMFNQILVIGAYVTLLCILFLKLPFFKEFYGVGQFGEARFMTAFFALFIFCGVFNSFNARTSRINLLAYVWRNKAFLAIMVFVAAVQMAIIYFGGSLFRTVGLSAAMLQPAILIALSVIPVDLLRKLFISRRQRNNAL